MSNYHVMATALTDDSSSVVFHIPVPDENNAVGMNLQTALSQRRADAETISAVPWLEADFPDEYQDIQDGKVYEHVEGVSYDPDLVPAQKRANVDVRYNVLVNTIPDRIRTLLRFWGLNRDVP